MNCFVNPENLPVEELTISANNNGVVQTIKALDAFWVEQRELTLFERAPSGKDLVLGALDAWKNKMQCCLEDLKWLLAMEHHKFWSTIMYHAKAMDLLVSFLQEAIPPYMPPLNDRASQSLYADIRKFVLIIFCRLITNKESKSHWMKKEYFRDLIYEKFVFTIPILWDLCLVYGLDNCQHVSKLVTSVFTLQPKYTTDLEAAIDFVKEALKYIIVKVNNDYYTEEPLNLPETFKGFGEIKRPSNNVNDKNPLTFSTLKDLVVHLVDTVLTIRLFVTSYPKSVDTLKKKGFVLSIVQLYEYGIPHLYEKLEEFSDTSSTTFKEVQSHIDSARAELIDIFREILAFTKSAIFNAEGKVENHIEDYLTTMMDALSEKLFIQDYHACYPIEEDLEMLKQAYPTIDSVKTDFILQALIPDDLLPENSDNLETNVPNGHIDTTDNTPIIQDTVIQDIPSNIREESLISEVKDILPHLGEGFILKCLTHYNFNSERVINSILEGSLDETLKSMDQSLPIIPEDPVDKKFLETGVQRLNIFDGDEFDIMTRDDVDVSKIHVGKKKSKYKNFKEMLNDKTDVKHRLDIYNKYSLVVGEDDMYSDEYDDTYDDEGDVVPTGDSTVDDLRRPFVTPRVLRQYEQNDEEESEEEEVQLEDKQQAETSRNRMDFCQNPEEIRKRREANFQMRNNKQKMPQPRAGDVIGKAKGQGQEKDVTVNRDRKEKHKSSRANHNRRQGAQWKRSQGILPS